MSHLWCNLSSMRLLKEQFYWHAQIQISLQQRSVLVCSWQCLAVGPAWDRPWHWESRVPCAKATLSAWGIHATSMQGFLESCRFWRSTAPIDNFCKEWEPLGNSARSGRLIRFARLLHCLARLSRSLNLLSSQFSLRRWIQDFWFREPFEFWDFLGIFWWALPAPSFYNVAFL